MNQTVGETRSVKSLVEIDGLSVSYRTGNGPVRAVRNVSLSLRQGEIFGLAGESGSGKSTLALAILNYLDSNGEVTDGEITMQGSSLLSLSQEEQVSVRGNRIAHVPQDPKTALNPSIRVGEQVAEVLRRHLDLSSTEARERTHRLFEDVDLSDPEYTAQRYPHELSGGMQQRVLVAIALACNPELIIMDEPTSGLDVTTKNRILQLIRDLRETHNSTVLLITHNLGVIGEVADRVGILYAGELMEVGPTRTVFSDPANPYTRGLLDAVPDIRSDRQIRPIPGRIPDLIDILDGCIFADRCELAEAACRADPIEFEAVDEVDHHRTRCRRWQTLRGSESAQTSERVTRGQARSSRTVLQLHDLIKWYQESSWLDAIFGTPAPVKAVDGVDLEIREGETVGLVGESGCGKSTLARTVLGIEDVTAGSVKYRGQDIIAADISPYIEFRSETGVVFQNPHSSLNPEKTVYESIKRPLELHTSMSEREMSERVSNLLDRVGLGTQYAARYPTALSGGEKQRIAIARAFAAEPKLVILDEPVSALDLSVQANILKLLRDLQREYGCAYLFISHDLGVVRYLCDRVAVMYLGEIVESGSKDEIFAPPFHPYTRSLISNIQTVDVDDAAEKICLEGEVPSAREKISGCAFHTRCPQKIGEQCERETPELAEVDGNRSHCMSCHRSTTELSDSIH